MPLLQVLYTKKTQINKNLLATIGIAYIQNTKIYKQLFIKNGSTLTQKKQYICKLEFFFLNEI